LRDDRDSSTAPLRGYARNDKGDGAPLGVTAGSRRGAAHGRVARILDRLRL